MKYYVTSDMHSFFQPFIEVLNKKGFDSNNPEHMLVVCGDIFDRGNETIPILDFLLDLSRKNKLIYIRGNHEDLFFECLADLEKYDYQMCSIHHIANGTVDTILDLRKNGRMDDAIQLINTSIDYYETEHYVFTHGWIPSLNDDNGKPIYYRDWRKASKEEFRSSRWLCGPYYWYTGVIEENKTIVCGHWNCGYANTFYHYESGDQYHLSDHPFIDKGIVAIDSCVVATKVINCVVIDD